MSMLEFKLIHVSKRVPGAWTCFVVVTCQQILLISLEWRHNERNDVSNHRRLDGLLNRLLSRRSKKTSKLHVTVLCEGNSPLTGEFPSQRASNAENVSIWWRHHDSLRLHRPLPMKQRRRILVNATYKGTMSVDTSTDKIKQCAHFMRHSVYIEITMASSCPDPPSFHYSCAIWLLKAFRLPVTETWVWNINQVNNIKLRINYHSTELWKGSVTSIRAVYIIWLSHLFTRCLTHCPLGDFNEIFDK